MSVTQDHLTRYRVELRLRSPLFIGSGTKLNRMEYVNDGTRIVLPDTDEMFAYLLENGLIDRFQKVIESRERDLKTALIRAQAMGDDQSFPWRRRVIPVAQEYVQRRGNGVLHTHIATAEGLPYIPGSSIKGAIRTALLSQMMSPEQRQSVLDGMRPKAPRPWEEALRVLEFDTKRKGNAVNDLMRAIQVSDCAPFPEGSTTIRRRRWIGENGAERELGLLCECVNADAETHFYLTIDNTLWPKDLGDPLTFISDCLKKWQDLLDREYNSSFVGVKPLPASAGTTPIVLGAGTGFQQHTLAYAAQEDALTVRRQVHGYLTQAFFRWDKRAGVRRTTYKPGAQTLRAPYCRKAVKTGAGCMPLGVCEMRFT